MRQAQRRMFLIKSLLKEQPQYRGIQIPRDRDQQKQLLRSLLNVRRPGDIGSEFLSVQNAYLAEENAVRGVTDLAELFPVGKGVYLWQGDITTLRCDAIVNAANSGMTGCYIPCHRCIDNCIHTYAGMQLRLDCARIMAEQGHEEPTGRAKITPAYNLPCQYVIHTVGPIIYEQVTEEDRALLASCYRSCLELAERHGLRSIAFCCISTGEFRFPQNEAAEIAVRTVREFQSKTDGNLEVIFNVFKDVDYEIYRDLLGKY